MCEETVEKMVDEVLDLLQDLDRAEDLADAAYRHGDLERHEDALREINRLDGIIYEMNSKIDYLGGI